MPTYEFLCQTCQGITEKKLPITSVLQIIPCEQCYGIRSSEDGDLNDAGLAHRIISRTTFILKGGGWSNQYKPNTSAGSEDEMKKPQYNSPEFLS